jgi:hypothetical protein
LEVRTQGSPGGPAIRAVTPIGHSLWTKLSDSGGRPSSEEAAAALPTASSNEFRPASIQSGMRQPETKLLEDSGSGPVHAGLRRAAAPALSLLSSILCDQGTSTLCASGVVQAAGVRVSPAPSFSAPAALPFVAQALRIGFITPRESSRAGPPARTGHRRVTRADAGAPEITGASRADASADSIGGAGSGGRGADRVRQPWPVS